MSYLRKNRFKNPGYEYQGKTTLRKNQRGPSSNRKEKILQLIHTASKINNLLIYDIEFKPALLRVFIDSKTEPVDLNLCGKFLKSLLFLLESEGLKDLECEVSSPGLERTLKKDWHFLSAIGEVVKIYTTQPVVYYDEKLNKKRKKTILQGRLSQFEGDKIILNNGSLDWTISVNIIKKARTVFENS